MARGPGSALLLGGCESDTLPVVSKLCHAGGKSNEEQCAVCWGLLCEPIAWPSCSHHFCLLCALRIRQRPKPTCPLCRAEAERLREASELEVDALRASQVRRSVGYSRYEAQRRDLWVEVAAQEAKARLGEMPLFAMGKWHFPAGSQQHLRFFEPRYKEMIRRALAPGGDNRFATVLCPAKFEAGAKGRICEIVESELGPEGEWHVVVEGGIAFQVLEVRSQELIAGAPPLFYGTLDEVAEDELADPGEDWTPLVAANEMVAILSLLGRHLQTMRRRSDRRGSEREVSGETSDTLREAQPPRPAPWNGAEPNAPAGQSGQEEVGAMVNLLMTYRQIISEMDGLLVQASQTDESSEQLTGSEGEPSTLPLSSSMTARQRATEEAAVQATPSSARELSPPQDSSRRTGPASGIRSRPTMLGRGRQASSAGQSFRGTWSSLGNQSPRAPAIPQERPRTQAQERPRAQTSSSRPSFAFTDMGSPRISMSETSGAVSGGSNPAARISSQRSAARRPRQALFSQAARSTFPGRRSGAE